jgi:hypothetical protein
MKGNGMLKISSLEELKAHAKKQPDGRVECFVSLAGGIARSSKSITYFADVDEKKPYRHRKVWDVFHSISDSWETLTDKGLMDWVVGLAMERGAFYAE